MNILCFSVSEKYFFIVERLSSKIIQSDIFGFNTQIQEHIDHQNKKDLLLKLWDETTVAINMYFPQIALDSFSKTIKTFGQYEGTVISSILYFIDNEIHHRGQGYVYLRSLGIEPPFFWER